MPKRRRTSKVRRRKHGNVRTVIRTSTSKTVTRMNPGLNRLAAGYRSFRIRLPRWRGLNTVFSVHSDSDRAQILKRMYPSYTRADHERVAQQHAAAEKKYEDLWSRTVDKASQETFGRKYQFGDYKISAIAREEYPERLKKILRLAAVRGSDHRILAAAHNYAASHLRFRK